MNNSRYVVLVAVTLVGTNAPETPDGRINLTDPDKVANRAGVRYNQAHQKPRRLKPMRSRSKSSIV